VHTAVELDVPTISGTAEHSVVPGHVALVVAAPSQNVTVPVGGSPVTVAVIVTGLPSTLGLGIAASVNVVESGVTVSV
jgi:hypothetical protein